MKNIINKLIQDVKWFTKKCVKFGIWSFFCWSYISIALTIEKLKISTGQLILLGCVLVFIGLKIMEFIYDKTNEWKL